MGDGAGEDEIGNENEWALRGGVVGWKGERIDEGGVEKGGSCERVFREEGACVVGTGVSREGVA